MAKGLIQTLMDSENGIIDGYCRVTSGKHFVNIALGNIRDIEINFSSRLLWLGQFIVVWEKTIPKSDPKKNQYEMTGVIKHRDKKFARIVIRFPGKTDIGQFTAELVEQYAVA